METTKKDELVKEIEELSAKCQEVGKKIFSFSGNIADLKKLYDDNRKYIYSTECRFANYDGEVVLEVWFILQDNTSRSVTLTNNGIKKWS